MVVNFHVTINKCITELIRGVIIRTLQVHAAPCTHMANFACVIFVDSLHRKKHEK